MEPEFTVKLADKVTRCHACGRGHRPHDPCEVFAIRMDFSPSYMFRLLLCRICLTALCVDCQEALNQTQGDKEPCRS